MATKIWNKVEIPLANDLIRKLLGPHDRHLRMLEKHFGDSVIVKDSRIILNGDMEGLEKSVRELVALCRKKEYLDTVDIETVIRMYRTASEPDYTSDDDVVLHNPQILVKARTANQIHYVKVMRENELVFSIGPAGTGKTFLAVAWAVSLFESGAMEKIILVKPAVEAGEKLGFLPGDIKEKVDPYFKPLYDALLLLMPAEKVKRFIEQSVIEIAPLAFMRGRTLHRAIAILDEAQNTTAIQMKMFLTRLGPNSRAVITGDLTQIDLEKEDASGLMKINKILENIKGIEFVYLDSTDVVRHKLVSEIIKAYDKYQKSENGEK